MVKPLDMTPHTSAIITRMIGDIFEEKHVYWVVKGLKKTIWIRVSPKSGLFKLKFSLAYNPWFFFRRYSFIGL